MSTSVSISSVSLSSVSLSSVSLSSVSLSSVSLSSVSLSSVSLASVSLGTVSINTVSVGTASVQTSVGSNALQQLADTRAETGLFGSVAEEELLEMRAGIIEQIKAVLKGDLVFSVSIAGKQVTKKLPELHELKQTLSELNAQLKMVDPTKYGKKRRRFGFDHRYRRV